MRKMLLGVVQHVRGSRRGAQKWMNSIGQQKPEKQSRTQAPDQARSRRCGSFGEEETKDQPEDSTKQDAVSNWSLQDSALQRAAQHASQEPKHRFDPDVAPSRNRRGV